ncbi:cartilage intermediate layer protein 1-like isoform X2 [Oculina patagonica]
MFRRAVLLRSVAIFASLVVLHASGGKGNVAGTNGSLCSQTFCKKGKMCVERKVGKVVTAECVCPTSCANETLPVCSVYHVQFPNICELHRFACANEINIQVKHQGNCTEQEAKSSCTKKGIVNFQDKYLQRNFRYYKADRVMSSVERLIYAKRDFDQYWDTDRNGLLQGDEISTILQENMYISKSCTVGLIRSCDIDGKPGISKQEWFTCFKTEGGQWRWSPWTDCSVTCGGGRQRRTGTCILPSSGQKLERRLCDGRHHETRKCSNGECPDWTSSAATDGKWSRWSPWTDCSLTCAKGRQSRTRTCRNKVTGKSLKNGWCAGKPQQEKTCADWKCPDLRNSRCPAANKEGTLKGRVLSLRDTPLAGANISLAESPYKILTRSRDNGYFEVDAFCFEKGKPLLITRHGYVPQLVDIINSRSALKVKMENAVHPTVTSHPEDRRRFVGQDVTFCCQVEGNPPPVIEWFRNENILDKEEFINNETLVLRNVGKNMAGDFRCRAVNEFGAEFSEPATLIVIDPVIDTCKSKPSDHFVTLPDGCLEDGSGKNKVNIGKCNNDPCLRADTPFLELCDEAERCCQPGIVRDTTVRCGKGEFKMKKVVSCRCDVCKKGNTIVKGIVVGGPDERPVEYCDILVNDTVVTYSDYDGTFEIPVHKSAKRFVATFRDYMEEYEESTVVLPFKKGRTTFHKIHLRPEAEPVEFNAEEEKAVPIAKDEAAEVIIPANSLIDKNGNPKKGKAKVKIQFNDPRNEQDILESPGDFTTVDEDGEEQLLRTYGVFKIKVQDENNQNLGLTKNLHLNIDLEKLTGETLDESAPIPHLWWLDEKTGRWVDVGELKRNKDLTGRPKRQLRSRAFAGEITPENIRNAYNLDLSYDRCFAKVKAVGQDGAGIDNAKVTSIFVNPRGRAVQGYLIRNTGSNGYRCISTQCNSDGYLEVEKDGLPLLPNQGEVDGLPPEVGASIADTRRIKFTPGAQLTNGPVYQKSQSGSCWSESPGQSFFSFHSQDNTGQAAFNQGYVPEPTYRRRFQRASIRKRCFLKVLTSGTTRTLVKAESYSENERIKFGEATKQTEPVVNNRNLFAVCIEHRCPERDATLIRFTVLTGECQRSQVQDTLGKGRNSGLAPNVARVLTPLGDELSGTSLGMFQWPRGNLNIQQLEAACFNRNIEDAGGVFKYFVVKFNCNN